MNVRLCVDGVAYDVTIEPDEDGAYSIKVGGRTFRLGSLKPGDAPGAVRLTLDDHPHDVVRRDLHIVTVDGVDHEYRIEAVGSGPEGGVVGESGTEIHPPMPGKVVALRVHEGDVVEAGQVLLVLEAMKMQNEVTCPATGVVTAIRTEPGAAVDTGDVLVVLGPPDQAAKGGKVKEVVA